MTSPSRAFRSIRVYVYTQRQRTELKRLANFYNCDYEWLKKAKPTQKRKFELWSIRGFSLNSRPEKAVEMYKAFQKKDKL